MLLNPGGPLAGSRYWWGGSTEEPYSASRKRMTPGASGRKHCRWLHSFGPSGKNRGILRPIYLLVSVNVGVTAEILRGDAPGFVVSARAVPHPEVCLSELLGKKCSCDN